MRHQSEAVLHETKNDFYIGAVPRTSPHNPPPSWDGLYSLAEGQAGYFTARQAGTIHFGPQLLRYSVNAGHLERAARGIYRLRRFPVSPRDELVPFWLWSEGAGVFSHQTALTLHGLSDVAPTAVAMTVPLSWRTRRVKFPAGLLLSYAEVPADEVLSPSGPIPFTNALRTINDVAEEGIDRQFLAQAVDGAFERNLLLRSEVPQLHPLARELARAHSPRAAR